MALRKILQKFAPYRLGHQIGLAFGILLTISLFFLGLSLINISRRAVIDSVLRDYEDIAGRASRELNTYVTRPQELLVNAAALLAYTPPDKPEIPKTIVYQLLLNHPDRFNEIVLTNPEGTEVITSNLSQTGQNRLAEITLAKVKIAQEPVLSRVYFSQEHRPYITIAVPVRRLNLITGFLLAEVPLENLWKTVDEIKLPDGEAFLVDEEGFVLLHNEERKVYRGENMGNSTAVQNVLQGKSGSTESNVFLTTGENKPVPRPVRRLPVPMPARRLADGKIETQTGNGSEGGSPDNGGWLCAYTPVEAFGWGLLIRQPAKTAYAFSGRMQKIALITIGLAILFTVFLTLTLARRIVRPINKIVTVSQEVAAGNLDQEISSDRNDELGGLLRSFDEMVKKLRLARRMEKLSAIGLTTSKIGHELRNPLVAIKTFIQLLGRRYREEEFIANFNRTVPPEMNRLEKMVNELTEFSAAPKLRITECNLNRIIGGVLELLREQFQQQNVKISTRIENDHGRVKADGERLKQVFINLINNALGAMPDGGKLEIGITDRPSDILIEIKDTGCGIPPEMQKNLFEPFQTFNKKDGLGLGLTICKEIIEQHKGRIEVISPALWDDSQKGGTNQGTIFKIILPL